MDDVVVVVVVVAAAAAAAMASLVLAEVRNGWFRSPSLIVLIIRKESSFSDHPFLIFFFVCPVSHFFFYLSSLPVIYKCIMLLVCSLLFFSITVHRIVVGCAYTAEHGNAANIIWFGVMVIIS